MNNYFKSVWRYIFRSNRFSLLNVLGLFLGMTSFVILWQVVQFEWSYDKYQSQANDIYRIVSDEYAKDELIAQDVLQGPALGPTLAAELPEVADYFRLIRWADNYTLNFEQRGETLAFNEESAVFADAAIVSYFDLRIIAGGEGNALLDEPQTVILSESTALEYFGSDYKEAVGKSLIVNNSNLDVATNFVVTGIYKDIPANSHFHSNIIFSHASLPDFLPKEMPADMRKNMFETSWEPPSWYTYLLIESPSEELEEKINELVAERNSKAEIKYEYKLQPISSIHLNSHLKNEFETNGKQSTVYFLAIIAFIILGIAWFNSANLYLVKALEGAKNVGIRNTLGAGAGDLLRQMITESLTYNLIAVAISITVLQVFYPWLVSIIGVPIDISMSGTAALFMALLVTGTLLTVLAPMLLLSRVNPSMTLNKLINYSSKGSFLRKGIVTFQLFSSLLLMAATAILFLQNQYLITKDKGLETSDVLVVEGPNIIDESQSFEQASAAFEQEVKALPAVTHFSTSSNVPGTDQLVSSEMMRIGASEGESRDIRDVRVNTEFFKLMHIDFIEGQNFSKNPAAGKQIILNELAAELLGFDAPAQAVGSRVGRKNAYGISEFIVTGVVNNFHQKSAQEPYEPLAFSNSLFGGDFVLKLTEGADIEFTLNQVKQVWQRVLPHNPFDYYFLDSQYDRLYQTDRKYGQAVGAFTLISLLINIMGIYALMASTVNRKVKEMGIRKVLGAEVFQLLYALNRQILILLGVAALLAIPLSYYFSYQWLNNYAFRIELPWWVFIAPVPVLLLIIGLSTIRLTYRASRSNPVDSLRYE